MKSMRRVVRFWNYQKKGKQKVNHPNCRVSFLMLALSGVCFGQGLNGKANVSPDLAAMVVANVANPSAIFNVVVQFAGPPTPDELAQINAHAIGNAPNQDADLSVIQGKLYSLPLQALKGVVNNPNVVYVSPDRPVQSTLDISSSAIGAQTASRMAGTEPVLEWRSSTAVFFFRKPIC